MIRISIAASGLGHVSRGIEAWADDLGKALADREERIILCKGAGQAEYEYERVVPCWTREDPKTHQLLKWIPSQLGWRIRLGNGYSIEQATFAHNLIKLLRSERIDVLHVQDPHVALIVQKAYEWGLLKTRTILAHGTEEPLEFQDKITFLQHLAPWHLEQARSQGVFKETWTAIPNFIDTNRFFPGNANLLRKELNIPDDGLIVLMAAAIKRHHKRVDYVATEFRTLMDTHPDLPAWLVIAGGWESETQEVIAETQRLLGDRVRFLVRFPRERMAELYRAADLFTLGSLKEMMPIALLEATASGLACVVHQHPVMQWMIGPGGIAADLSQPGGWSGIVSSLLHHHGKRHDLGEQARHHCLQNFSRDTVVDQILAYYQHVFHYGEASKSSDASRTSSSAA